MQLLQGDPANEDIVKQISYSNFHLVVLHYDYEITLALRMQNHPIQHILCPGELTPRGAGSLTPP